MKKFCFTDSSGILKSDRFFGTGLLVTKNIGDLNDKLCKSSQPVKALATEQKLKLIDHLTAAGKYAEAITILRKGRRFEMKFDRISDGAMRPYYEQMVEIFLADADNRFSAMIVDKTNPLFDHNGMGDAWETYTKYVALLVVREMQNLQGDDLCLVVDEITRPRSKNLSLEDTIMTKIREEVAKHQNLAADRIFGAFSIESHSNLLMQLCDVLLGSVMYDYKKDHGLSSATVIGKKETFVQRVRTACGVRSLAQDFEVAPNASFSVCESV